MKNIGEEVMPAEEKKREDCNGRFQIQWEMRESGEYIIQEHGSVNIGKPFDFYWNYQH